jgi:hypothetical protein
MKNCNPPQNQHTRGIRPVACLAALAMGFLSLAQLAHADQAAQGTQADELAPPPVPATGLCTLHGRLLLLYEPLKAILAKGPDGASVRFSLSECSR